MFELIRIFIALIGSGIAGIWDLKTTNIPDSVCIAMIISAFSLHTIQGFLTNDFSLLINATIVGALFLIFSLVMYFTGQWGGGDGELLIAIGVLLPVSSYVTYFPFSLSFFINMIFIGAIYSIIYSLILAYRNPKVRKDFFKNLKETKSISIMIFILILFLFSTILNEGLLSLIFILLLALFIFQKFAKSIERGFYKRIPVSKLKPDDMIGEDIPKLKIYKKFIRGLTKKEVQKIKKYRKYVKIKEGIRYGIVFFLALLFTLLYGDFLFLLF